LDTLIIFLTDFIGGFMPAKVYKVTLNDEERSFLNDVTSKGRAAARKLNHAHILLKADQSEDGPGWDDKKMG
jgi:hypothetical protein